MRLIAILSTLLIVEFFSHLYAPIIRANTPLLVDQFNRTNISPWVVAQNEGSSGWNHCLDVLSPAKWQIENGWAKLVVDGVGCTLAITPSSNQIISSPNWQVDFDWRLDESINMDRNFVWWWQDKDNWYDLKLYGTGITAQKVIAGLSQPLENNHTTFPFLANEIYHFTIKYQNQRLIVFINGQKVLDIFDQNPLTAGSKTIALKTSLGSKRSASSFDNLQVFSLPQTTTDELEVPLLKQTDVKWSQLEYDSAKLWSPNPTIDRWGCALTATAMVMRYYQLTFLPDGQEITPASLNEWLKNQIDGYIGDGLLNWLAISRLSAAIHLRYGTPKLEYQRLIGSDLTKQVEALTQNLPLIFNITGHFLVANGYNQENQDFTILDPYYIFRNFKQHGKELLSSRLFTPSYTDLSYLLFVTKPEVEIRISADPASTLETEQFEEKIVDPISGQENKWKITQIRKPKQSNYKIEITNHSLETTSVSFYSYNQTGQVLSDNLVVEKEGTKTWQLNFDPASETMAVPSPNAESENNSQWAELIGQLENHYSNPFGKFWPVFDYLLTKAKQAEISDLPQQLNLKQQINETVSRTPLSEEITTNLLKAINLINLVI